MPDAGDDRDDEDQFKSYEDQLSFFGRRPQCHVAGFQRFPKGLVERDVHDGDQQADQEQGDDFQHVVFLHVNLQWYGKNLP